LKLLQALLNAHFGQTAFNIRLTPHLYFLFSVTQATAKDTNGDNAQNPAHGTGCDIAVGKHNCKAQTWKTAMKKSC
jgi:hypothetical protein